MAAEMEKITVKYVAKTVHCGACERLEELKDKVRESGEMQYCFCTCGAAQAWPVREGQGAYD
mgnify:CR=1 FL=1